MKAMSSAHAVQIGGRQEERGERESFSDRIGTGKGRGSPRPDLNVPTKSKGRKEQERGYSAMREQCAKDEGESEKAGVLLHGDPP